MLSNPLLITWGGSWAARSIPALPSAPASASNPITTVIRFSFRVIGSALLTLPRDVRHMFTPPRSWHPSLLLVGTPSASAARSVRGEFVRPELPADLSDLVACLLAQRVGGHHVVIPPVREHLEHFDGGLLEEAIGGEVLLVVALDGRRRLQRAESRLGAAVGRQRLVDPFPRSADPCP